WRLASTAASRRPASRLTRRTWVIAPSRARAIAPTASRANTPPMPSNSQPRRERASRTATAQANRMRTIRMRLEDTVGRSLLDAAEDSGRASGRNPACDETRHRPTKRGKPALCSVRAGLAWLQVARPGRGRVADPLPHMGEHLPGLGLAQQAQRHAFPAQEQGQALARFDPRMVEVDVVGRAQHRPVAGEAAHRPCPWQRLVAVAPVVAFAVDVDHHRLAYRPGYLGHLGVSCCWRPRRRQDSNPWTENPSTAVTRQ